MNNGIEDNGYIRDIYKTTNSQYIEKNEPVLFNNHKNYSLSGIIEQSSMSDIFFSDMNTSVIQDTIRYNIFKETNKKIDYQSPNSIFIIMRSIYLQFANSFVKSEDIKEDIRNLNKRVTDYSTKNIKDQLDQYDGYIKKISGPPIPMEHPRYENKQNYTYDSSNILN